MLAEELGHHYTTSGEILDMRDIQNRKQEYRARLYGYNIQVGLMGLIRAYENGCRNLYEIAEYLGVSEKYLSEAIDCYKSKYGELAQVDNYVICFVPTLAVVKINNIS